MTISEEKINEGLRSVPLSYTVTVCNVAPLPKPSLEMHPVSVSSTTYGDPVFTGVTRDYLLRLRREIEQSGVPLKTDSELEREIDEMRGR